MERLGIILLAALALSSISNANANVISLGVMIAWLDPNASSAFSAYGRFNGYGCYCGLGGSGRPVDEVDCCCQAHDACYEHLVETGVCSSQKTLSHLYAFSKEKDKANGKRVLRCKDYGDACANGLCQCDVTVARCFTGNESKYQTAHAKMDRVENCDKERWLRADICR